jgi:hypothetical protein
MQYLVQPLAPHAASGPLYPGNDNRVFVIAPAHSGLAVTVVGNSVQLQQQQWQENANQQWRVISNGDGTWRIQNVGTNLVMDVEGGSTGAGARVLAYAWHGGNNQRWRFSEASQGHFQVQNVNSRLSLDLEGISTAVGAKVIQYTWNGGLNQHWILSEVRPSNVIFDKQVTIYEHGNYGGRSQTLGVGSWDMGQLTLGNDTLSSLQVPAGMRATLYQDANFRGNHVSFTSDTNWVGDFNDKTSAVLVEKVASFYSDANYGGNVVHLGVGRYDMSQIQLGNDTLSSLKIPQGLLVTVYEHAGFAGDYRSFYQDTPWVGDAFNDKASSIVIKHVGVVIPEKVIKFGDSLQLRSAHGTYVVAESDGRLLANRTAAGAWEQFIVIRAGATTHDSLLSYGDVIALKSAHGKYVVAESSGDANANRDAIGDYEKWQIIRAGATQSSSFVAHGDAISLKSMAHGKYLVAENTGDANANRTAIGPWETFTLESPTASTRSNSGGLGACGAEACGADACGADACGADACGAAACGAAATLIGVCGAAAAGIAVCGADVAGAGVCAAAACGAAAAGIAACGADACGAAACGAAACGTAVCGAAACGADACGAAASGTGFCAANACGADAGGIDACPVDACGANVCGINACPADACAADACGLDIIPIIPGI